MQGCRRVRRSPNSIESLTQTVGRHNPGLVDRQQGDTPAAPSEGLEGVQNRLVLDGARDEMSPACRFQGLSDATNGKIVRFGSPAREHDLGRLAANQCRNRRPGVVQYAL